ncbi:hypothetical protein HH214_01230 [Mucilaginibacter robiniae]|uniref:Lipoprotein n=1 Tax=Mucilaginibacter robiniae TaxID=2728022 RepID=A0A7L5DV56_9SPHI|nr:hypothetical protein [Mucilaginibacter robiniae]QJD94591.1 hypothetical protein HH214_01230 [Mucilaginibacter robiniae]
MRNKVAPFFSVAIGSIFIITACNRPSANQAATATNTQPKPVEMSKPAPADTGRLVGVWYDESIKTEQGQQIAYEVVSKGKKIYIQAITFNSNNLKVSDSPVIEPNATLLKRNGNVFINANSPNEIYKVDKAGNLLIYDQTGLVVKCKKVL